MSAQIIDGRGMALSLRQHIADEVARRARRRLSTPGLSVILVGEDAASALYVRNKRRACLDAGMRSEVIRLPAETDQSALLNRIDELNARENVDGILIQLPLPGHMDENAVIGRIRPDKDVDGFHPYNMGCLVQRVPGLRACTPLGIMYMLDAIGQAIRGRHAVVVGASNIVGRPLALELLKADATVTLCHRYTSNLSEHIASADILAVAIGQAGAIRGAWVKPGATVIDVGMNRRSDGKLQGDIEFATAREQAAWITPVPGGVGPMTVAMLLHNTLLAARSRAPDASEPAATGAAMASSRHG